MRIIPSYLLGSSLYCETACPVLSNRRKSQYATGKPLNPDKWAWENIPLDVFLLFCHLVVWSIVLFFIEGGYFKIFIGKFQTNKYFTSITDVHLDEDV